MNRRTFLCEIGGALLFTVSGAAAARRAAGFTPCIALFDPGLVEGRALARDAARASIEAWPLDDDIGLLWHARLARRVGQRTSIIAALRPSDAFVLTRLAATHGDRPRSSPSALCLRVAPRDGNAGL